MSPLAGRRIVVLTCVAALVAVGANSVYQWGRAAQPGVSRGSAESERIVALDGSSEGLIRRLGAVPAGASVQPGIEGRGQTIVPTVTPFSQLRVPATIVLVACYRGAHADEESRSATA